ncbi:hypothetical protein [Okeania sp. KiyG1]|uniref:hypothetical protein n=1 Tax=Okeania sp. KiyG1 TaxID=2720165 RepID=UPI00192464DA|nr:hypothetical protein [Okeania sp. KiyG1]GGA56072.1 hypothetical protein CYANOKiyG1_76860 [Okeania sp. KiyG1]
MQNPIILPQFVLSKLAKAPIITVQISALDLFVICQALLVWSNIYPGKKMAEKLVGKFKSLLFFLLPNCRNEITLLLTYGASKAYDNIKTNS